MASESVSFLITRTAEDLAHTVTALSHRLIQLEQRLGNLESTIDQRQAADPAELEALGHVEELLRDCRLLLDEPPMAQATTHQDLEPHASEPLIPPSDPLIHHAVLDEFPNAA